MRSKYDDLSREVLAKLLQARDKRDATHGTYGNILVLNLEESGSTREWFTVRYDAASERAFRDGVFRLDRMRTY